VSVTPERLHQTTVYTLMRLEAEAAPAGVSAPDVLKLLNELEEAVTAIRAEELPLAVSSPLGMGQPRRYRAASSFRIDDDRT
jgi:hypothetical protein